METTVGQQVAGSGKMNARSSFKRPSSGVATARLSNRFIDRRSPTSQRNGHNQPLTTFAKADNRPGRPGSAPPVNPSPPIRPERDRLENPTGFCTVQQLLRQIVGSPFVPRRAPGQDSCRDPPWIVSMIPPGRCESAGCSDFFQLELRVDESEDLRTAVCHANCQHEASASGLSPPPLADASRWPVFRRSLAQEVDQPQRRDFGRDGVGVLQQSLRAGQTHHRIGEIGRLQFADAGFRRQQQVFDAVFERPQRAE